ncbi:MAG: hypothetical protein ABIR46_04390 [Candidatus Saccharimonadales bacterium]
METLNRPSTSRKQLLALRQKQLEHGSTFRTDIENPIDLELSESPAEYSMPETHDESDVEDDRVVSPLAERIRNATERFANRLEKRSMANAHNEALDEYHSRDHSGYVDHVAGLGTSEDESVLPEAKQFNQNLLITEERRSDRAEAREALVENAEVHLRILGNMALERSKDAGYIALGVGVLGYKAIEKRVQTASFHRAMDRDRKQSAKQYAKETARLGKQTKKDSKALSKLETKEMRQAARYDRKFERSMSRKATAEKIVGTYEKSLNYATAKKKKLGSFALTAQKAGVTTLENKHS